MQEESNSSLISNFLPEIYFCDFCNDSSLEDDFTHIEESQKDYNGVLCDTCFHDHKMYDRLVL